MTNEMELPQGAYVATMPTGVEKIWKILWSVDPARLKRIEPDVRVNVGKIAMNYQITVSRTLAELHTAEANALEDMAKELRLR